MVILSCLLCRRDIVVILVKSLLSDSNYIFFVGDADDVGIPKTNTWYFNGYDTDECFDKYFEDPTNHKPPTVYLGFPCTKVSGVFL